MKENKAHSFSGAPQAKKSGLKPRMKGYLCAAFASVALVCGGCSTAPVTPAPRPQNISSSAQYPDLPETVTAFGEVAYRAASLQNNDWQAIAARQKAGMSNVKNARKYDVFLDGFNIYAQEPLKKMAQDVNAGVVKYIAYNDNLYGKASGFYWAAPVQTVLSKAGDCKDYATLQYAILRHLGVPENRLMVTLVSASGSSKQPDHVVLLLNVAPKGAAQNFIVLNDGGAVVEASRYVLPLRVYGWKKPYVFYEAANQSGVWLTSLGKKLYVPASVPPALAQISLQ